MSRLFLIVGICAALNGCVTTIHSTEQPTEREIQEASNRFIDARQSGDASSFAALFTEDGMFMVPGLLDAVGRSGVRELAQKRFAGARSSDLVIHRREIQVLGDSASELAWFSETSPSGDHRMEGRHLIVWKRGTDDVWRVHRYLYSFSDAKPLS
ncbi:MAG: SgcJ/EcaC family oxidoreductase [Acidobacteria bacterium]|nr:SgcJ/EcaC family oxidoreductase [Acidobacteriota bacterium]